MTSLFTLSRRNIWRNKRRTLITIASILFAVLLSSFMQSIQRGAWGKIMDNVVNFYFGYAQIHTKGYWEEQSINKAFKPTNELSKLVDQSSDLKGFVPRLESFALAANENNSSGVLVIGTDPEKEAALTDLDGRIIEGRYLKSDDNAVLVAAGIAENLEVKINDTLVLISQGYHGVNAAGKYPIKGIVKFGSPDLNKQMVYLPLSVAQNFYGADGLVTSLAVQLESKENLPGALNFLQSNLDTAATYEVMSWQQLMPELVQAREVDTAGNYIILFILYVIITFGIFGTVLMMTKEREYEFGVLLSIGMSRAKIGFMVWLEIVMLGLIGAAAGIIASLPLVFYFYKNPVDFGKISEDMKAAYERFGFEPVFPTALDPTIFTGQAVLVFIITCILAAYPLIKIFSLKPVEAMRA